MIKTFTLFFVLLFCTVMAVAQNRLLTGNVKDTTGAAMPGVNVQIKSTGNHASTDGLGNFKIICSPKAVLTISSVGYQSQELKVGDATQLNIILKSYNNTLNEVVVTALGVTREKRTLTYATQSVSGNALVDAKQDNLINALAGKVAGVQITNSSGMPGSSSQIIIRGNSTLVGDNTALIVIDGVPVDNSEIYNPDGAFNSGGFTNRASDIDPNIIESINVLKGAAATALYGSAG